MRKESLELFTLITSHLRFILSIKEGKKAEWASEVGEINVEHDTGDN